MQDSKIIVGLIAFTLCVLASCNEFFGKRNYKVCFFEIALGIFLMVCVVAA